MSLHSPTARLTPVDTVETPPCGPIPDCLAPDLPAMIAVKESAHFPNQNADGASIPPESMHPTPAKSAYACGPAPDSPGSATTGRWPQSRSAPAVPLVSVLMLAYNHEEHIEKSIQSILDQQTSFPFELLIGEDCSKDRTREIAARFARDFPDRVRLITSETNVGMHANGRRLEEAFRGQYVAYCEGDDYWHATDKLERQIRFLEEHPEHVMVHSDYRMHFVDTDRITGRVLGPKAGLRDSDAYNELLFGRRIVGTLTACLRANALRQVLASAPECYDPRFLMGDTQRWFEIARLGRIHYMPEVLATRRILAESATRSCNPARVLRFTRSAKDVLDHYAAKYPADPAAVRCARLRSIRAVLQRAYVAYDIATADAMVAEARSLGLSIGTQARLEWLGTKHRWTRPVVKPALALLRLYTRVRRRASILISQPTGA